MGPGAESPQTRVLTLAPEGFGTLTVYFETSIGRVLMC